MATPIVESRSEAQDTTDSLNIPTPAGTSAGDLLLVAVTIDGTTSASSMAGFTELYQEISETFVTGSLYYRISDGTEGANLVVSVVAINEVSARAYRVSGYSGVPEFAVTSTGDSITQTSPPITPTGGVDDYLYLVFDHIDTSNSDITTFPSGYVNTGSIASTRCMLGYGEKPTTATSTETPSSWALVAARRTVTSTIAIFPVGGGGGVSVTATLGAIEYSSNDTAVNLSGAIDVNTTLGAINYTSNNSVVSLSGDVGITATLGAISYSSNNASIQISGETILTATLGAIEYSSNNTVVNLIGNVDLIATLGAINYSSNDAVVSLSGGIAVNATLGTIDYTSNDTSISLQGQVSVVATLGAITYGSNDAKVKIGTGQFIGTVTAGFADDIYLAGFKQSEITVNFKS